MATTHRLQNASVIEQILSYPHRFDFFQAVRLIELEALQHLQDERNEMRYSVGYDGLPALETLRFKVHQSLAYAVSDIHNIVQPKAQRPAPIPPLEMQITFMGVTGASGVLPVHYTELLLERLHLKDAIMRDFFDLFNHRLISLYYRAWEKNRFYVGYEKNQRSGAKKRDTFSQVLACLTGIGTKGLENRLSIPDETLFYYAGLFAQQPRSASGLEHLLSDFFQIPVHVKQFQGEWIELSEEDCTCLPSDLEPQGLNAQLSVNTLLGTRVWHCQNKFRVQIGPVNAEQLQHFLPQGAAYVPLCELIKVYAGIEFIFDIQVILQKQSIADCKITMEQTIPPQLGWNTWLGAPPFDDLVNDVVLPAN